MHQPWRKILSIHNKRLTGKASGIDRARESIVQILWGIVNSVNVDFAELFTKLILQHLLSHNPNLNKHLDSLPHNIGEEARLEKLKYVAKEEPKGKPTFGMPISEAMMSKGYMCKVGMKVNAPTPKRKKDVIPRCFITITFADNLMQDQDEALEYAKPVNMEEIQQQEKERQSKQRHAGIMLERQVNKEVDEDKVKKARSKGFPKRSRGRLQEKTESDKDSEHGDESGMSDYDEESVEFENDESDKDFDDDDDQAADFVIRPHDKESLLNEPSYTEVTTVMVTPLLDTIHESQEDPAKNVTNTPAATTLPIKTKKKHAKILFQKAIQKKNDWKKAAKNVTNTPAATTLPIKTKKKQAKALLRKAIEKKNYWNKAVKQRPDDHVSLCF
ncbi:hypothetical protein Tco_0789546 [Tanacetum coccineum]